MRRRNFLHSVGVVSVGLLGGVQSSSQAAPVANAQPRGARLAGMTIKELCDRQHQDLFERFLPFWDKHGIDHEYGGFLTCLDHDGTRLNTNKFHWFQGNGIWVWSYLYNHLDKNPHYLEVARKSREFLLKFAEPHKFWPAMWSREGEVLKPFSGDTYGMLFGAEGFQEYAAAAGNEQAHQQAVDLLHRVFHDMDRPDFRFLGTGAPGVRALAQWFITLEVATQLLQRGKDPGVQAIADRCVEAVMDKYYNPELGLFVDTRNYDFSPVKGEESLCPIGHAVEAMWVMMKEAERRKDETLYNTCVERLRRHFEVGWDPVFGGLSEQVNVGHGCYDWPAEQPMFTSLEFRSQGEFDYMKSMWALDSTMIATMMFYEKTGAPWSAEGFSRSHHYIDDKFSLKEHGYLGWLMFLDRKGTFEPHGYRQDNYHHPRQLMYNLLVLDRLIKRRWAGTHPAGSK